MRGSVPAQGQALAELGGKLVSELVSADTRIDDMGDVYGTLKYVEGWKDFSSVPSEQDGHFFPITLDEAYASKPITVKRDGARRKTEEDREWVLRVPSTETRFTFEADGKVFLTLRFDKATLAAKAGPV